MGPFMTSSLIIWTWSRNGREIKDKQSGGIGKNRSKKNEQTRIEVKNRAEKKNHDILIDSLRLMQNHKSSVVPIINYHELRAYFTDARPQCEPTRHPPPLINKFLTKPDSSSIIFAPIKTISTFWGPFHAKFM